MVTRPWMHAAWMACLAFGARAADAALLPEVTPAGQVMLPYSHRFTASDRLVSTPTFTLASGLSEGLEASLRLALDSDIQRVRPELEPRITYQFGAGPSPWRMAIATAYNTAAVSADAGLFGAYQLGSATLRGSSCAFSSGFGVGGPTAAMGLGLTWRLNDWLAASGDYGGVVLSQDMEAIANQLLPIGLTQAWRLGLLLGLDGQQHLELYVTNSHTHTLQGLNRGSEQIQVGFEYQVPLWRQAAATRAPEIPLPDLQGVPDPFTISMASQSVAVLPLVDEIPPLWLAPSPPPRVYPPVHPKVTPAVHPKVHPPVRPKVASVLLVRMGNQGYAPATLVVRRGTVVRWVNHDRISHTATAHGQWDSLWKKPGKVFERQFTRVGTFYYRCKRHPHERGVVRVI